MEFAGYGRIRRRRTTGGESRPATGGDHRGRARAAEAPWRVTAPYQALARHEKVQALATELQFAVCKDYIDHPENLADYGLQPAHARITFQDNLQGEKKTIWVGDADTSPDKKGLFVKAEGQDAVLVIENPLLNLLPTTPTEWRDLRLLTRRVSEIKEVTYTAARTASCWQDAEGAWSCGAVLKYRTHSP